MSEHTSQQMPDHGTAPTPETDALESTFPSDSAWSGLISAERAKHIVAGLTRERDEWKQKCEEARRAAVIERDKHCHPDHGGHLFPWEEDPS